MGHKITLIAPAYTQENREDKSIDEYCENILLVDSIRQRPHDEIEALYKKLNRPKFFLTGDGGYCEWIDKLLKLELKAKHFDAIISEYSIPGQYLISNMDIIPEDTMTMISIHECYTNAFKQRVQKGEDISEQVINELYNYEFKMYEAVDRLLPLTHEDGDILVSYNPKLKDKIRVVPHGVDTEFFIPPK
jgi:hydroxymethylpyrimidine pyrophosphatase-like HAD family hydrolase